MAFYRYFHTYHPRTNTELRSSQQQYPIERI